jgi:integrase
VWSEFDLYNSEWRIPAERMKMREQHIVPLSRQAVAILRKLQPLSGRSRYVFPSLLSRDRSMSANTVNTALRRLGYGKDEMTGHGFRSMASTCLNEQGWHPALIELQLAHAERNKVRAAYNKAQRLAERRTMMQSWADWLDALCAAGNVVPIRRQAYSIGHLSPLPARPISASNRAWSESECVAICRGGWLACRADRR